MGTIVSDRTKSGWVEQSLGFRWIAWINAILAGVSFVSLALLMQESRGSAILDKRAHRQTLQTGIQHVTALASEEATSQPSFLAKMKTSVSRPLLFLTTEPIVTAFSLWCGTLWGVLFIFYVSIPIIYWSTRHCAEHSNSWRHHWLWSGSYTRSAV